MRFKYRDVAVWGLVLLTMPACEPGREGDGRRHPVPELLERPAAPAGTLILGGDPQHAPQDPETPVLATWLDGLEAVRIGSLDGPGELVVGNVQGAVADFGHHQTIVLDGYGRTLRLFDEGGRPTGSFGRGGSGPGEFLFPRALDLSHDGRLWVFEASGAVSVFEVLRSELRYSHRLHLGMEVVDGCVMNDRIYIHGRRADVGAIIHAFTLEGIPLRSFGEAYSTDHRLVQRHLSRGVMACEAASGTVLFAPSNLPTVQAYDMDGQFIWWAVIEGFVSVEMRERGPTGFVARVPDHRFHVSSSLVSSREDPYIILQVASIEEAEVTDGQRERRMHTFLLSHDGKNLRNLGVAPSRVVDWRSGHLVAVRDAPFPQVVLVRSDHAGFLESREEW